MARHNADIQDAFIGILKKSVDPFEIKALTVPKFFSKVHELDGLKGHEVIVLAARQHGP